MTITHIHCSIVIIIMHIEDMQTSKHNHCYSNISVVPTVLICQGFPWWSIHQEDTITTSDAPCLELRDEQFLFVFLHKGHTSLSSSSISLNNCQSLAEFAHNPFWVHFYSRINHLCLILNGNCMPVKSVWDGMSSNRTNCRWTIPITFSIVDLEVH